MPWLSLTPHWLGQCDARIGMQHHPKANRPQKRTAGQCSCHRPNQMPATGVQRSKHPGKRPKDGCIIVPQNPAMTCQRHFGKHLNSPLVWFSRNGDLRIPRTDAGIRWSAKEYVCRPAVPVQVSPEIQGSAHS